MNDPVPAWKFWHPLPLWQVLSIGLVLQIVCVVPLELVAGGLGLSIPSWIGSGIAGGLMYVVVRYFASRRLEAERSK